MSAAAGGADVLMPPEVLRLQSGNTSTIERLGSEAKTREASAPSESNPIDLINEKQLKEFAKGLSCPGFAPDGSGLAFLECQKNVCLAKLNL